PEAEIEALIKKRTDLIDKAVDIRSDIYDAVEALIMPGVGLHKFVVFSDFFTIAPSRGYIGKAFETALKTKVKLWGIEDIFAPIKVPFTVFDPGVVMGTDPIGRVFLSYQKALNWGKMQDAMAGNRLLKIGEMPFKIDKNGGWVGGKIAPGLGKGIPIGDMIENLDKYREAFSPL
ncbi:MAG: hypothetical protein QQN63_14655, partial [Nitrosopumilus sp.]